MSVGTRLPFSPKQIEHKEIDYEKPNIVMEKVLVLEKEIANDMEKIRSMIQ